MRVGDTQQVLSARLIGHSTSVLVIQAHFDGGLTDIASVYNDFIVDQTYQKKTP